MLEGLVAWVLNNYLGKYVENLNTDQLSVALLSGKVELENLPLKKDALRGMGVPMDVVAGVIGRVQLQVPVRQLRTAPWLIHMERVYLVAQPINLDDWDAETEAAWAHERKMAALETLEARWRARQESAETYYSASYSSWLSYGTGLLAGILENLQLTLTDVHIRYEDAVTCARPFACGLTIGSLVGQGAGQGADGNDPPTAAAFKLFELQQLALYWDPMPESQRTNIDKCTNAHLASMESTWTQPHRYLVQPCTCTARARRDHAPGPLRARDRPRLAASLTLSTVAMALSARQYGEMVCCARGLERLSQLREYRSLRPSRTTSLGRHHWVYALRCHSNAYRWTQPRPTWESCLAAARAAVAYVAAVQYQLTHPTAALPAHMQRHKDEYEWRTPLLILTALTETAMRRAEVPKSSAASTPDKPRAGRSVLVHWFPTWWGWYGTSSTDTTHDGTNTPPPPPPPPPPLEEELLDVIADSLDDDTMLKRDALFGQFEFVLTAGCLRVSDDDSDSDTWSGVEVSFSALQCGVEWRPRGGALSVRVSLGSLSLRERLTRGSLFPVLAAPHGLVRAHLAKLSQRTLPDPPPPPVPTTTATSTVEPLFQLTYDKKPYGFNCDYKLWVKSASLEVVWSAAAARWALRWVQAPFTGRAGGSVGGGGGRRAQRIISQLGHMMRGRGERRVWHIELDICAPQILLVEDLCDRDAAVMVVDFGRLRLANAIPLQPANTDAAEDEEEEMFMTPCSTPPGSLQSPAPAPAALDANTLHHRIYDRYKIELSDLQILAGRARDNWKYAHTKASSSLHLLDRFSILLQAERRVVATNDPLYPAGTLCGSLPALVAHLSEHKLQAVRAVFNSDNAHPWYSKDDDERPPPPPESSVSQDASEHDASEQGPYGSSNAALFMLQFAIEQMSIEVQSLGRSIAEVQVGGARAALTIRPGERSLTLSVHSLLLADALQTYGPDFELLVASHKHVGMDTMSGSIRGSEPTSPTSPASPSESTLTSQAHLNDLTAALHSLHTRTAAAAADIPPIDRDRVSPTPGWHSFNTTAPGGGGGGGSMWGTCDTLGPVWGAPTAVAAGVVDCEALIAVELTFVKGEGDSEDLRIANILFNNLDIIANQETIVELIGFAQRVTAAPRPAPLAPAPAPPPLEPSLDDDHHQAGEDQPDGGGSGGGGVEHKKETRTEITFDFHRLGVLLLRAAVLDGAVVANKIATATLSEAKIRATVACTRMEVGGSLGGVQVVSLCEGAGLHTRVASVGRAPPAPAHTPLLSSATAPTDDRALMFSIERTVDDTNGDDKPVVSCCVRVHVASVWYTHSGALLHELQSCLSEFKQYLSNLARSIRAAAADMAIGLVHVARGESLYANPRMEGVSPRRRTTSMGCSLDDPTDYTPDNIQLSVSVELESPVVVLPRAADSAHVLVAHLGRMSLSNRPGPGPPHRTHYTVRVRDISLAAVNVSERLTQYPLCAENMERIYCVTGATGAAILHDTALRLVVSYTAPNTHADEPSGLCEVSGSVVGGLHVSAARDQYEQVLETARWVFDATTPTSSRPPPPPPPPPPAPLVMEGAVTLQLDPQVRAAVLAVPPPSADTASRARNVAVPLKVLFSLGTLAVELRGDLGAGGARGGAGGAGQGERSLVQLTFQQLTARYHRAAHHTTLQVSLHSVWMEDLTQPPESAHRVLMMSHTPPVPAKAVFVSASCPDLTRLPYPDDVTLPLTAARARYCSLPARLNLAHRRTLERTKQASQCGATPPCSPDPAGAAAGDDAEDAGEEGAEEWETADDNLVWVHVHTRDADHPDLQRKYNDVRKLTRVDFNCLNLVLSIDSWVAVLDFFGVTNDDPADPHPPSPPHPHPHPHTTHTHHDHAQTGVTQTEVSVRSLSVVVVGGEEVCRALVSRTRLTARADTARRTRTITGRLGQLLLSDLTAHSPLWRDRFRTHGDRALTFTYQRLSVEEAASAGHETSLHVCMGPVTYVHTKRFVHELQAFARDFALLRAVIAQARLKVSVTAATEAARGAVVRMSLRVRCTSPVIVLPISGRARGALAAELHSLYVDNCFRREPHLFNTDSQTHNDDGGSSLLDVRSVQLEGLTLYATRGCTRTRTRTLRPHGASLLSQPANLTLLIETNLSHTHHVPDMTISGTLTTLSVTLDPAQYRLARGVLAHNLGASTGDLVVPTTTTPAAAPTQPSTQVWTLLSLKLSLQDVSVRLEPVHGVTSLACINFIKSRLLIETYSDLSQDIDLVSQEILVSDTRYATQPANRRGNVFSHIVQPLPDARHSVQAEVHARKREESSAYTILVNNMRLMCVLDWWECANQFIMQPPPPAHDSDHTPLDEISSRPTVGSTTCPTETAQVELKLNVTDSQLVLVEDASLWDTNAVILKSTTVITYRPLDVSRPVVCEVNELEVFSCVLGMEDDTALPILEPAALTATVRPDHALTVEMSSVSVRLSYHDMLMFAAMARSLPAQARAAAAGGGAGTHCTSEQPPANRARRPPARFHTPLWRVSDPVPPPPAPAPAHTASAAIWPLRSIEVVAECIALCVIDDCLDSDVPLLEVSLTDIHLQQDLRKPEEAFDDPLLVQTPAGAPPVTSLTDGGGGGGGPGGGRLVAILTADYYNRTLSGWEPVVEPWRFTSTWECSLSQRLRVGGRVQLAVSARGVLDVNVTSALVDLVHLVRTNWTKDYYSPQTCDASPGGGGGPCSPTGQGAGTGHRRRLPFVPYALRNHTGHKLWFTTLLTTCDRLEECSSVGVTAPDDSWVWVRAGDTEPFSFGTRRAGARARAGAAGRAQGGAPHPLHRLAIRLERWLPAEPVCVDRVGTFWREVQHAGTGARARLVLHVELEGSARKLVTVRSALRLHNRLPHAVEVRVDAHTTPGAWAAVVGTEVAAHAVREWSAAMARAHATGRGRGLSITCGQCNSMGSRMCVVETEASWSAPLGASGALWTRPLVRGALPYAACALHWYTAADTLLHAECHAPPDTVYRMSCSVIRDPFPASLSHSLPGHTLTLLPALRLTNLLPVELTVRAVTHDEGPRAPVALSAAADHTFTDLNIEEGVELSVKLEGFGWSSPLSVGGVGGGGGGGGGVGHAFSARLKLRDTCGRRLYLSARVGSGGEGGGGGGGACVTVSAAYWIVNRTHLPLVFRVEGAATEVAGQFEEHEVARMVAPLVFAFAETEGGPTLQARLGRDGEWSAGFGLGVGGVKRLEVRGEGGRTYWLGVSARAGRGRHRHTNIVTLAPRHQLHNNTPHVVQFTQKCMASTVRDPMAMAALVSAPSGCCMPWHWPRADRDPLLCVRLVGADGDPLTAWSGGFRIDTARTLHVACRESRRAGGCEHALVRVETAVAGCSLLCVLGADDAAPPPLRFDNYSPVAIMFHQVGCGEECVVGAHGTLRWALPEPEGTTVLAMRAPGGPKAMLPLDALPQTVQLLYQNFIYIAFTSTTTPLAGAAGTGGDADGGGVLVLEVPLGSTRVVLARRRHGDRAQLWRRGPQGQLVHEGSGPPTGAGAAPDDTAPLPPAALVLDIEDSAPRPPHPAPLALRRADPRRQSTQAWRVRDGRMGCAHANLCVQPEGGIMGLAAGGRAVLALPVRVTSPPSPEQAVSWHTLRPGSGRLEVSLLADGPTRVLQVRDHAASDSGWIDGPLDDREPEDARREWGVRVTLAGVGASLVGGTPSSELVYARLTGVALDMSIGDVTRGALAVHAMQWDNQLPSTPSPVLLHALAGEEGPMLTAAVELARAPRRYRALYFQHVMVALRPLGVRLEERLMLQLWAWAAPSDATNESLDDDTDARTLLTEITSDSATRCYIALIKLIPSQIRLSMATASKLERPLSLLKRRLGLTLIRFEDAAVELEPFVRAHVYDTPAVLARHAAQHFKDELKWQAAKILGSVDFLGAPLGFVADVSEGVSGLLLEGNVSVLVSSVAHGLSNSAAKVSSSLGDGLERVVADEAHEETRRRIRQTAPGAHLAAGLRGLGLGLLGGVTSLVKHSYEGAAADGLPGFLAGVGKGLVGTVTKPVIGVLDLAAEAASALRETSRRGGRTVPERVRPPRCAAAAGSLLPRYCVQQAAGARALLALNGGDTEEQFLAYGAVRGPPHDIRALLSTTYLRIFTAKHQPPQVVMETHLSNLVSCACVESAGAHYVELGVVGAGGAEGVRRPRVQCDSAELAAWLARHAAYARQLHREHKHTLYTH